MKASELFDKPSPEVARALGIDDIDCDLREGGECTCMSLSAETIAQVGHFLDCPFLKQKND